ncbi:hypothetical protein [Dryocola sp. LX212]
MVVTLSQWGTEHLPGCKENGTKLSGSKRHQPLRKMLAQTLEIRTRLAQGTVPRQKTLPD